MFQRLTADQVNATHRLYKFLRYLSVIGSIESSVQQVRLTEDNRPIRYRLNIVKYDPTMKGRKTRFE